MIPEGSPNQNRKNHIGIFGSEWVLKPVYPKYNYLPNSIQLPYRYFEYGVKCYSLVEHLGSGSYAEVYKATAPGDSFTYAIKIMPEYNDRIQELINIGCSNENEAKFMSRTQNSHLIECVEYFRESGYFFIVMPYCDGGDLTKYITSLRNEFGYLTEFKIVDIAKQIRNGLRELYASNIVHRDLKPANILVHGNTIKISDFGFSIKGLTISDERMGSQGYFAPEICSEETVHSYYYFSSDIWAFGVILWEIITGELPFENGRNQSLQLMSLKMI